MNNPLATNQGIAMHEQTISNDRMTAVFNEWARQYAVNPDAFGKVLDAEGRPLPDYGSVCTAEFNRIHGELFGDQAMAADIDVLCVECGHPTMHIGNVCFSCSKAKQTEKNAGAGKAVSSV